MQRGNVLLSISGPICRTTNLTCTFFLLHQIRDTIVQDANNSEGTGSWANIQAVESHVPAPSLTTSHYLRIASSQIDQTAAVSSSIDDNAPAALRCTEPERAEILRHLGHAVYLSTLMCFVHGLDVMERENEKGKWGIKIPRELEIWKKQDASSSPMLSQRACKRHMPKDLMYDVYLLCKPQIAGEVKRHRPSLKKIVLQGIEHDAHVPCLSATLEYLKYIGGTNLSSSFTEAQLNCFGAHGNDLRSEPVRHLMKGKC